ncbi:MAG: DUF2232 domain-containing protein [Bacteriovoracaceae bacterium]
MALGQQEVKRHTETYKRLAALTLASLLLCLSFIMSFFASFPVALAALLYGRSKGYGAAAIAWSLSFVISFFVFRDQVMFATYTASLFVTVVSTETVLRNVSPMKGVVYGGSALLAIFMAALFATFSAANLGVKEFLVKEIQSKKGQFEQSLKKQTGEASDEAFQVLALLEQPEVLAEKTLREAPGYIAMGIFLILWANIFLLLKSKRTLLGARMPYTDYDLTTFKAPEHLIWAVIAALGLAVFGDQVGEGAQALGMNALKVLGVFYFFQGFGLYVSFLDHVNLRGLLRAVLVILTVLMAAQVLALLGLFDMFVNFRRFMKKKDQGE